MLHGCLSFLNHRGLGKEEGAGLSSGGPSRLRGVVAGRPRAESSGKKATWWRNGALPNAHLGSFRTSLNEGCDHECRTDFQSTDKKVDAFVTVLLQRHFAVVKIFFLLFSRTASVGISLRIKKCIIFPQND